MKPAELKIKVGMDAVEEVFTLILANQHNLERSVYNDFVLLSQNYFSLQKENQRHTITTDNFNVRNNQIIVALLGYIDALPPNLDLSIPRTGPGQQAVELKLGRLGKEYSYELAENLKKQVAQFTGISPNQVVIIAVREGSLIIRAILPNKAAFYLLYAFQKNPQAQFFKSMKAESVRVDYTSPLGYLAHLWYKVHVAVHHKPALYILAAIVALGLIAYGLFQKYNEPAPGQMGRLMAVQQKLVENNNQVMKIAAEHETLVKESLELNRQAKEELDALQAIIDSLGEQAPVSYSRLLSAVQAMDQNSRKFNEKIDTLNTTVERYFTIKEELIALTPKTQENLSRIEQLRSGDMQLQEKLKLLKTSISQLKANTVVLLSAIQAMAKSRPDKESKALIYACNATMEHTNAIGELRVI